MFEEDFDFSVLPSLIFIKILRLLSPDFSDIRNLSYVSKSVRARILDSLDIIYNCHVDLDNSVKTETIDLKKPVLSLKLTCSAELVFCPCSDLNICDSIDSHAYLLRLVAKLDLSNLKSLEIRNLSLPNRKAFKGLLKIIPLNPSLVCSDSLECLAIDVCLINLSEIRNSIINVVYQHDDFETGGPITNIDYIVNSAVSQVLYSFLQFVDDLYSGSNADRYDPYGRSKLRRLDINFLSEEDSDWGDLDPTNFSRTEISQLKECLSFMINEFKERITLNYDITEQITVKGIPNLFYNDAMELTLEALEESTRLWPVDQDAKAYSFSSDKLDKIFNLSMEFKPAQPIV